MENISNAKIAVTGGTGFLGRHLLRQLGESGADISCLARPGSSLLHIPRASHIVTGDCSSGEGLVELASGKDVLIHMASLLFGSSWNDYLYANALACQNLAQTIKSLEPENRPQKIIFVSSLAAAGPCGKLPGINEQAKAAPVSAYGWSKLLCEKIFQAAGLENLVILRPAIIYGSGDKGLLPMFKSAALGLGISPGYGRRFPVSIIHADDAARAIILACGDKACGIYHLDDGQPTDMDAFCEAMGAALGKKSVHVAHVPLAVMGLTAACSTALANTLGRFGKYVGFRAMKPLHWNLDKFREARQPGWLADASRIRQDLGFEAMVGIQSGMEEAVSGYREEGLL